MKHRCFPESICIAPITSWTQAHSRGQRETEKTKWDRTGREWVLKTGRKTVKVKSETKLMSFNLCHLRQCLSICHQLTANFNPGAYCCFTSYYYYYCGYYLPSVLRHCWLGVRKNIRPVKNRVIRCWHGYLSAARFAYGPADANATPSSRFVKIQIGLTFLVPAYPR